MIYILSNSISAARAYAIENGIKKYRIITHDYHLRGVHLGPHDEFHVVQTPSKAPIPFSLLFLAKSLEEIRDSEYGLDQNWKEELDNSEEFIA